jgi:copper chaperone CopZ
VSLEAERANVAFDPAVVARQSLLDAIEDAGFDAE